MRNRSNKLQFTFLSGRKHFVSYYITYQYFYIAGFVFATTRAVRIVQTHLLGKTIDINYIYWFNTEAVCQLFVKEFLTNLFTLQFLPTTYVDDLGAFR